MEYIKREELIEGEIYYVSTTCDFWMIGLVTKSNNGDNRHDSFRGNATFITKELEFKKDQSWCYKANRRTYRLATPEEKHWLETCIKLDKFIEFDEAMKTFDDFVLPEFWSVKKNSENHNVLNKYFTENQIGTNWVYNNVSGYVNSITLNSKFWIISHEVAENHIEITFEQFKKYVLKQKKIIEPLPQFKIVKTIETITEVENNEGSLFRIGDVVLLDGSVVKDIIKGFKYGNSNQNLLAILTGDLTIDINCIEHFVKVKSYLKTASNIAKNSTYGAYLLAPEQNYPINESLLDKAKRLYPHGTTIISLARTKGQVDSNRFQEMYNDQIFSGSIQRTSLLCIYSKNEWAEIIEYPHGFKVGDKVKLLKSYCYDNSFEIERIEGNQLFLKDQPKHRNSVLAKNVIKLK